MQAAKELAIDRRLIEGCGEDPGQFAQVYERYFDRVFGFSLTLTRDRMAAQDVTSETFRRALQAMPQYRWRGIPLRTWLFRIASNAASDFRKRAARETELNDLPDGTSTSPETFYIKVEEQTAVIELVKRLPRDQRRVIAMRFGQETSIKEIAKALGRSEGAVKQLQFRAIQSLQARIGESHG